MNNKTDIVVKNQYISSPFYVNLTCTDNIESHMKALTGWDTCYNQISEGAFEGEVFEFACQDTQIFRSQCNQSLSKQGSAAGDTLLLSMPIHSQNQRFFCDGNAIENDCTLIIDGYCLPTINTPKGIELLTISVDKDTIFSALDQHKISHPQPQQAYVTPLISASKMIEILNITEQLYASRTNVFLSPEQQTRRVTTIRALALEAFVDQLEGDDIYSLKKSVKKHVVDKACAYMFAHIDNPPTIMELCHYVGASRRKLQYCFQDTLGVNPIAYLKALRLNSVHRDLLNKKGYSVQRVAENWGFFHLGRFSVDYHHFFGEVPSKTLKR